MKQNIDFIIPKNKAEVLKTISDFSSQKISYVIHAGGTDLVPLMKKQEILKDKIVFLSSLPKSEEIKRIIITDQYLLIGSLVTLNELYESSEIKKHFSELSKTAGLVATPQIQNKATLGGNILVDNRCVFYNQSDLNQNAHDKCFKADGHVCHLIKSAKKGDATTCRARFVSDLVPVLLILNASLILSCQEGEREVLLNDFYHNDGIKKNHLWENEILLQIKIPLNKNLKMFYQKLRVRDAIDFPSLGVALGKDQEKLLVGITGVDTKPLFKRFDLKDFKDWSELVETAAKTCMKEVSPLKQDFFPPAYRKKMVAVYIREGFKVIC